MLESERTNIWKGGIFLKNISKYLSLIALAFVLVISSFAVSASAATKKDSEKYLTPEQVEEMNTTLQTLKDEANEKLATGEENFTVSQDVTYSDEPLSFTFDSAKQNNSNALSTNSIGALATYEKTYSATVSNTAGFNFSHRLYGSFIWGNGQVYSYTKYSQLEGASYYKTHSTSGTRLDPSIVDVHSNGNFEAFRYFTEYKTAITIRLTGSGTYRVTELRIINPHWYWINSKKKDFT